MIQEAPFLVTDILKNAELVYKDKILVTDYYQGQIRKKSLSDLKNDAHGFSQFLLTLGRDIYHVGLLGVNKYEWIVSYMGIAESGNVSVPIDYRLKLDEIFDMIKLADIDIIVYDKSIEEKMQQIKLTSDRILYFICFNDLPKIDGALFLHDLLHEKGITTYRKVNPDELCSIYFTSGTTQKVKAVMLSHRNIVSNVICTYRSLNYDFRGARLMAILPSHHLFCINSEILSSIYTGVELWINDEMANLIKNMLLFKPTILMSTPIIVNYLYKLLDFEDKRQQTMTKPQLAKTLLGIDSLSILSAGAYLNIDVINELEEYGITIRQGYGMTECSPTIATNFMLANNHSVTENNNLECKTSVGKIISDTYIKIINQEIYVKSPSVMMGYYKDEDATNEVLCDGWLRTGDLGYADENNYVFLIGRKKNLIILSSGENINPEVIENKLIKFPVIKEVIVYNDNDLVTALIFPDFIYSKQNNISNINEEINSIIKSVNSTMSLYYQICEWKFRANEFEKNSSNKIKREVYNRL